MTIEDIRKLITDDEHRELEVKKSTGELKDEMHSACAFLNTDDGWLIFAWRVIRFWHHEIINNINSCITTIKKLIHERSS